MRHSSQSSISISMFGASTPFCLIAPPAPPLFGVFAFHRRSPFITGVRTPSIRCLCNNSLSILACIGKVFACCLHQEHKRLLVVHSLCSELYLRTLLLLAPIVSIQYLVRILRVLLHNLRVPRAISVLQIFSLFLAYV